ncbi:MAG: hypothetical protein AAGE37_02140 [Pseudomonadota bacterium]
MKTTRLFSFPLMCCVCLISCTNEIDRNRNEGGPLSECKEDLRKQTGAMSKIKDLISDTSGKKQEYFAAKILAGTQGQHREYILLMKKGDSHILITDRRRGAIKLYKLGIDQYNSLNKYLNFEEIKEYKNKSYAYYSSHLHCSFFEILDEDGITMVSIPNTHGRILDDDHETLEERVVQITREYDSIPIQHSYDSGFLFAISEHFKSDEPDDVFHELR